MSAPSAAYMAEYRKRNAEKIKAQQIERDKRKKELRASNTEAMAQYRQQRRDEYLKTHPNAKTMAEHREAQKLAKTARTRVTIDIVENCTMMRICESCNCSKTLEDFSKHGVHGRKKVCKQCTGPKVSHKAKTEKPLTKFVVTKEPKPQRKITAITTWDTPLLNAGWVRLLGMTDTNEWIKIYIRGAIIMFIRGSLGSYSAGKQSYGVMLDDSGKRYPTLSSAERVAQRIFA